jgi:transposase
MIDIEFELGGGAMMGQRQFSPKLFYQFSLDSLVPETHLLRRIAAAVDFSFIRPLCRDYYSTTGQPSIDPVVLFKMLLVGYLYGISSERRLAQEVELHLAYRWFVGYDLDEVVPDHSVLSKARARLGPEVFEEFFRRSITLCREAGLLSAGPVYVDSTLFQAAAAVESLVRREELTPPLTVSEYLERLNKESEPPPPEASSTEEPGDRPPLAGRPNQELESRTDPEATLVNRPAFGRHLAYKAHVAVAGTRGQVITAIVASTGADADEHYLADVLWHHRRLSHLTVSEVVADAKYGTAFNYEHLEHAGITAFIPSTRFGRAHTGIWGSEHFQWLAAEDVYVCPAGERLRRAERRNATHRIRYQAPVGVCQGCPFRARCAPSGRSRSLHRQFVQDLIEAAKERTASPLGKRRLRERQVRVEGTFGLAKELHGLRRTRFRGRARVQIQLWMTAAAMNIKRAVQQTTRRATPGCLLSIHSRFAAKPHTTSGHYPVPRHCPHYRPSLTSPLV